MQRKILLSCICLFILLVLSFNSFPQVEERIIPTPYESQRNTISYSNANVDLTWTARDSPTPSEFVNDEIYGDHITISAVSGDYPATERAGLFLNPYIDYFDELPSRVDDGFDPFTDRIEMYDNHFSWAGMSVEQAGFRQELVLDFISTNCDVMAWSENTNSSEWYYSNNLLGSSMSTFSNPEISNLVWPVGPEFAVFFAIYNHDEGRASAMLQYYDDPVAETEFLSDTVTFDTYFQYRNFQSPILYCSNLDSTSCSYAFISTTYFGNFFYPEVNILAPEIGANWTSGQHNITWTASDRNADDEIWFELSLQYGEPGQFIDLGHGMFEYDSHSNYYYHTINATGIQQRNYIVRLVGHDNDTTILPNWPDLRVIQILGPFIFGDDVAIPYYWPSVTPPSDIQFNEGELGHSIIWIIESNFTLDYTIYLNDIATTEGYWTEGEIEVSLNHLLTGTYQYRLEMDLGLSDIVLVTVLPNTNTITSTDVTEVDVVPQFLFVLNIGTAGIILVIVIRLVKHKDEVE